MYMSNFPSGVFSVLLNEWTVLWFTVNICVSMRMSVCVCMCVFAWLRVCLGLQRETHEVVTGPGVVLAEHHWTPPASGYTPVQQTETILGATHLYLSQNTHSLHCTEPPSPPNPLQPSPPLFSSIHLHFHGHKTIPQFSFFSFFFSLPSPPAVAHLLKPGFPIGRCSTQSDWVAAATMQMVALVVSCVLSVVRWP